jgi:hypothetical protein
MTAKNWSFKIILLGSVLLTTEAALAGKGEPKPVSFSKKDVVTIVAICDSVPENQTTTDNAAENKQPAVIKEVPKSKKQAAPVSVTPVVKTITPVKVVKPKIIKPVIKIN